MMRHLSTALIAVAFFTLWCGLFHTTHLVNENPRWYDDRSIYDIATDLDMHDGDWVQVLKAHDNVWGHQRFMPGSTLFGVISVALFGPSFTAQYWLSIFMGATSSFLLYLFLRQISVSKALSFFFPCLMLLGAPSEGYLQLARTEPWGVFLLSIVVVLMPFIIHKRNTWLHVPFTILFFFLAVLTAVMKESFLLILPALGILYLFLAYTIEADTSWRDILKRNWQIPAGLCSIFVGCLLIAKYRISAPQVNVVGPDLMERATAFFYTTSVVLQKKDVLLALFGLILLFFCYWWQTQSSRNAFIKAVYTAIPAAMILFVVVLPQALLHSNLGMQSGRYWIPATFGTAFCCVWVCHEGLKRFPQIFRFQVALIILYALVLGWRSYWIGSLISRNRADNAQFLLSLTDKTQAGHDILFVVGDHNRGFLEVLLTAQAYLRLHSHCRNIYIVGGKMESALMGSPLRPCDDYRIHESLDVSVNPDVDWDWLDVVLVPRSREEAFLRANPKLLHTGEWTRSERELRSASWFFPILYVRSHADHSNNTSE